MKPTSVRVRSSWFLLPLLFMATVAADPQCAQVDDRVTAPHEAVTDETGGNSSVVECIHTCNDVAKEARDREAEVHKQNLTLCGKSNPECKQQENARHSAVMDQIDADQDYCKALCHDQGSGSGGQ